MVAIKTFEEKDKLLYECVRRMQNHDVSVFEKIYELTEKYIFKIINDVLQNVSQTEDVMQETYLQIYRKIDTLQAPEAFYVWAGRIATGYTYRYIKTYRREILATTCEEDDSTGFMFDTAVSDDESIIPENVILYEEKRNMMSQILDELSAEQKLSIQYFYYEEMSVNEIASIMGCSTGTVKSRLNYARNSVKKYVSNLEKTQGTRLYSFGGLSALYIVFRYSAENILSTGVSKDTILNAVESVVGASFGAEAGASLGSEVGASLGAGTIGATTVAKSSIVVKVLALITAGSVATGGVIYSSTQISEYPHAYTDEINTIAPENNIRTDELEKIVSEYGDIEFMCSDNWELKDILVGEKKYNPILYVERTDGSHLDLWNKVMRDNYDGVYLFYTNANLDSCAALYETSFDGEYKKKAYDRYEKFIKAYERLLKAYRVCMTSEQYKMAEEAALNMTTQLVGTQGIALEELIQLAENNPNDKAINDYFSKTMELMDKTIELCDIGVTFLENPISTMIMKKFYNPGYVRHNFENGINGPQMIIMAIQNREDEIIYKVYHEGYDSNVDGFNNSMKQLTAATQEVLSVTGELATIASSDSNLQSKLEELDNTPQIKEMKEALIAYCQNAEN